MRPSIVVPALAAALFGAACQRKTPPAGQAGRAHARILTVAGFKTPESVKYDPELDVYFVTNINGNPSAKDDNGFISRVRPDGTVDSLAFVAGGRGGVTLHAPKGMAIVGDTLWVADIDAVRGFDKRSGASLVTVDLSGQGAQFLNDIAVGPDGALYITDTGIRIDATGAITHPGPDRIFRVGPGGPGEPGEPGKRQRAVTVAAEGEALSRPNGITWDARGARFIVVSFGGPAIFSWRPGDRVPSVLARGPGGWDGVEVLADGRILASSWADSTVDVVAGAGVARVIGGVPSPADIGVDPKRHRVLIPIFQGDRVEVWPLPAP
jgi:sugar lactone lactonase YvrE